MDPVTFWLLKEVVAPEAHASIRKQILEKTSNDRLQSAVRDTTGLRLGRRYKHWLRQENTWRDLVGRNVEAYGRLVDSLTDAEARRLFRRRSPDGDRAVELVKATIAFFLPTLDASWAVAVADVRAEDRHAELLARFDGASSYEERLGAVPPAARRILEEDQVDRGAAEKLVYAVTNGDSPTVIASLVSEPPTWLADAPAQIALAVAEMAQSHGLREQAGAMFEKAADLGRDRHWNYARAAFQYGVHEDKDRCAALLQRARTAGPEPWADVVQAAFAEEWERLLGLMARSDALADPFTVHLYAAAMLSLSRKEECTAFLTDAVDRYPEYSALLLRLGNLLLERSTKTGTTSRTQDQRAVRELAERARDLRRSWQGSGAEAVELACRAAIMAGDFQRVLQLGMVPPDGIAFPDEAAEPEVQFAVAQAAMALGRIEHAGRVAETATGFRQALIKADMLAETNAKANEVAAQYERAWELAETEDDKFSLWLSASAAGIDPVPGAEELRSRTDDMPAIVEAQIDVSCGRFEAAIDRLRPFRHREAARRLLVGAYLRDGRIDDAVAELIDSAERFDNPEHLVGAVEILIGENRINEAVPLAERTLRLCAGARTPLRNLMHEVGVAAAHNRGAWKEMEERLRGWINDTGADSHRRWLLVQALFNQAEPDAAWRILREGGDLKPETAFQARLWTVLHTKYQPGSETLAKVLALCEQFPDNGELRADAVNAFLLRADSNEEVDAAETVRWQALIRQRAEDPEDNRGFVSFHVPENSDEMIETFRQFLEAPALQIKAMKENVRRGWPYGMLAAVGGRTYTAALVHRAMGYLAPFTMNETARDEERRVAMEALDDRVLVDLSTLAIGWFIGDRWPQLMAAFQRVELTSAARRDVASAVDQLRPRSVETLGWDPVGKRPVIHETPQEQLDRLEVHTRWMETVARSLSIRDWPLRDSQTRLSDEDDGLTPWLAAVELAAAEGTALWADDVGLRELARNEGVRVFGTSALIDALVSKGTLSSAEQDSLIEALRDEYCVDLPLDPSWINSRGKQDGWRPGVAQFSFSRAASWIDLPHAFEVWRAIVRKAGAQSPDLVPPWVYSAAYGVCDAVDGATAHQLVAALLVTAAGAVGSQPAWFAACVEAAKAVCKERQLLAPIELTFAMMLDILSKSVGPDKAATAVANLGSELTGEDKTSLRRLLFGLRI